MRNRAKTQGVTDPLLKTQLESQTKLSQKQHYLCSEMLPKHPHTERNFFMESTGLQVGPAQQKPASSFVPWGFPDPSPHSSTLNSRLQNQQFHFHCQASPGIGSIVNHLAVPSVRSSGGLRLRSCSGKQHSNRLARDFTGSSGKWGHHCTLDNSTRIPAKQRREQAHTTCPPLTKSAYMDTYGKDARGLAESESQ
jgi:hypothetical protein